MKSTYALILIPQFIFENFPMNWNKETLHQHKKQSQIYLRKIIVVSAFIKLSLLILGVLIDLRIFGAWISVDITLILGNIGAWKIIFLYSLSSDVFNESICLNLEVIYLFYALIFSLLVNYRITLFLGFRKPRTKTIMNVLFHWYLLHFWKLFGLV